MKTRFFPDGYTRRGAFRLGFGTLAASLFGGVLTERALAQPTATPVLPPAGPYTLPPLPYAYDALEPAIDALTMQIHHDKHHRAYVDNANKLLADHPDLAKLSPNELLKNLDAAPEAIRTGLRNNVGGHVNHSLFWQMLTPKDGGKPSPKLMAAIEKTFGSYEAFQKQFVEAATKRFGSGWAWLVEREGKLEILSTANQDAPIMTGYTPLLGLDVWEHAYYLKYQNRRADYIAAWWSLVNWNFVNAQFQA